MGVVILVIVVVGADLLNLSLEISIYLKVVPPEAVVEDTIIGQGQDLLTEVKVEDITVTSIVAAEDTTRVRGVDQENITKAAEGKEVAEVMEAVGATIIEEEILLEEARKEVARIWLGWHLKREEQK
jgi:hypothetical protein